MKYEQSKRSREKCERFLEMRGRVTLSQSRNISSLRGGNKALSLKRARVMNCASASHASLLADVYDKASLSMNTLHLPERGCRRRDLDPGRLRENIVSSPAPTVDHSAEGLRR